MRLLDPFSNTVFVCGHLKNPPSRQEKKSQGAYLKIGGLMQLVSLHTTNKKAEAGYSIEGFN